MLEKYLAEAVRQDNILTEALAARSIAALKAKNEGATLIQIANALGLSRSGAQHLIERQRALENQQS